MEPLLRHTLATLSYRLGKVLRDAPEEFASYPEGDTQTAGKIVAHIGDLMEWALTMVNGESKWHDSQPLPWKEEINRFYVAIAALDTRIAEIGVGSASAERLFQGPIADALTHTGQLAMMRRHGGMKMGGENYYVADIATGRVGPDQTMPRRVF
jgi:hypothetical protein